MNALMTEMLVQWWSRADDSERRRAEQYLQDWIEMGAVDAAEGERWIERLRGGEREDGAFVDQLAGGARGLAQRAFAQAPERLEAGSEEQLRLNGVVTALHLLSTVPAEESIGWFAELSRRAVPAPPDPDAERRQREAAAFGTPRAGEVLRVLAGPPDRRAGLRVVCLELFEDCLAVQWHSVGDDDPWPRRRSSTGSTVAVGDDLATLYVSRSSAGSLLGGPDDEHPGRAVRGYDLFVPAPPPDARRLTVEYERERFDVVL